MKEIDFFNFEDKDRDIPIYNNNPKVSIKGWILLFIALFIGSIFVFAANSIRSAIISCIVLLVPVLYVLKWDYKLILRKPTAKEILLAIGLFVGYVIYTVIVFKLIGVPMFSRMGSESLMSLPPLVFSLMSEELIKFIPFVFFMRIFFKFSNNRKLSIILSVILVLIFFAYMHTLNIILLISAMFIQGFGSVFEFIGYIKTKNLWVPYITHLCTDVFFITLAIYGINLV